MSFRELTDRRRDWKSIAAFFTFNNLPNGDELLELSRERRWQLILLTNSTTGSLPRKKRFAGALGGWAPGSEESDAILQRGIPAVRLGKWPSLQDAVIPAVIHDRPAAGRVAAEHFVQQGFTDVAFIGRQPWGPDQQVYASFAKRAAELGSTCHLLQENSAALKAGVGGEDDLLAVRQRHFTHWLDHQPKPLGVLTFGDPAAAVYSQWVLEAGLRIPEDIAMLGLGNQRFVCECAHVPLSSVAFDVVQQTRVAVATLEKLMAGERVQFPTVMIPPLGVVTRQSTDVLAASHPSVVTALQFMWEHITEDLSVDQIVQHVGVPRRTLERAFEQELGRGIYQEYLRRRMEMARDHVMRSGDSIGQIARTLGFSSSATFGRAFRDAYGVSPARYRRRQA